MILRKSPPGTYPTQRCGPTLVISIAVMVLLAFIALFVMQGRNEDAAHKPAAHPVTGERLVR